MTHVTHFDVEEAVRRLDDPQRVMNEWFSYENRTYPQDYGVVFFRGWETFSAKDKVEAVIDAKRVLTARWKVLINECSYLSRDAARDQTWMIRSADVRGPFQ